MPQSGEPDYEERMRDYIREEERVSSAVWVTIVIFILIIGALGL
jgi:hypothetical protein